MTIKVRQQLYQQAITNVIGGTAYNAPQIGYLDANKTQLEVQGTLTQQSSVNYFKFAFRKGDKFNLNTNNNKGVRVQLMDASGNRVIADSVGSNASAKKALADLKGPGKEMRNGNYVLKVTYDGTVPKSRTLNYDITLSAGPKYVARYKTLAAADTIQNQLLAGGSVGYTASATTAATLLDSQSGTATNIIDYLA